MRYIEFTGLLGFLSSDAKVQSMLQRLRIARRPACRREDEDDAETLRTQDWLLNRHNGVELGFEDRATFLGEHPDEVGNIPMMLTEVYFYGDHSEVKPFAGQLPNGLLINDDQTNVRRKLKQWENTRRSYKTDTWELPDYRMTISYVEDGARIGFIRCALRPPEIPVHEDDIAILPEVDQILKVIGQPLNDSELSLVFAPLRLDQVMKERGDSLVANLKLLYGLQLYFNYLRGSSQFLLSNVLLFPGYAIDAAGWPNGLPFGLNFHDSPEIMLEKVGRTPDSENEMDFIGTVIWHFPEYSLAVEFSTMENHLLSVEIMAPGAMRQT